MRCARAGCDNEVPVGQRGRPRRFCSDSCKASDYRRRQREPVADEWVSAITGEGGEASLVEPDASPDAQVVAAVHETILLRNTYARLGRDARPELGARCESMAETIGDGLLENFRGAVSDGEG
jgi:hypothetical protein